MLTDLKFDLCYAFNQSTENLGTRQISRDTGLSLAVVSRIKNYKVDELTVDKLIESVLHYKSIVFSLSTDC